MKLAVVQFYLQWYLWASVPLSFRIRSTEAQRYHCKYNFTTVSFILLPGDLFYCREFYFTAARFILLPRVLFYCREFYFTATRFILLPRVLLYCREFYYTAASFISPPRVFLYRREFYFAAASFIFTTCSKIKLAVVKIQRRDLN